MSSPCGTNQGVPPVEGMTREIAASYRCAEVLAANVRYEVSVGRPERRGESAGGEQFQVRTVRADSIKETLLGSDGYVLAVGGPGGEPDVEARCNLLFVGAVKAHDIEIALPLGKYIADKGDDIRAWCARCSHGGGGGRSRWRLRARRGRAAEAKRGQGQN